LETQIVVTNKQSPEPPISINTKIKAYWSLIKDKQTLLLVLTGWAGFSTASCPVRGIQVELPLMASLFLAISGATVLNMVIDRDIDAKMDRTTARPLPTGVLSFKEGLGFAVLLSILGLVWSFHINSLYGWVVLGGLLTNVVVYSLMLKRKTPYSIIFGGIAGGMPILAGRTLGLGNIDLIGILLASAILLWIPIHIMTFSIKYAHDYGQAEVPTFPSVYGVNTTRLLIATSAVLASLCMVLAGYLIGMQGYLQITLVLISMALVSFAVIYVKNPSPKLDMRMFKIASLYMMGAMLLMVFIR